MGRLLALIGFAGAVAGARAGHPPTFVALAVVAVAAMLGAGVRPRSLLVRLPVVLPVLGVAAIIPVLAEGGGPTVAGVQLSSAGLESAWTLAARAVLGVTAATTLSLTMTVPELASAARRLHAPPVLVAIATMMLRYVHVVGDEFDRSRRSMASRGFQPRWFWQYRPLASAAGTLFIRSYERGERVHGAMVSRGFNGTMAPAGGSAGNGPASTGAALRHWWAPVAITTSSWAAVIAGHLG